MRTSRATGRQRLRIRVVDGRVEGETVHRPAPGTELVQKWTYMQLTSDGLTFGYINGMRPRGMLLFEGTRRGDTLAGDMRFAGINVRGPNGEAVPTIHFEYQARHGRYWTLGLRLAQGNPRRAGRGLAFTFGRSSIAG